CLSDPGPALGASAEGGGGRGRADRRPEGGEGRGPQGACHSMQWVAKEHRESIHGANGTGVRATCHDCHIPREYPKLLWYKAVAGTKDVIGEIRGIISTEEKFKAERMHMAAEVWTE